MQNEFSALKKKYSLEKSNNNEVVDKLNKKINEL